MNLITFEFSRAIQLVLTVSGLALAAFSPVTTQAQTIHRRLLTQQERIATAVRNGTMTPGEAVRLESREVALHDQIKAERSAQGGALTPAERTEIQGKLN